MRSKSYFNLAILAVILLVVMFAGADMQAGFLDKVKEKAKIDTDNLNVKQGGTAAPAASSSKAAAGVAGERFGVAKFQICPKGGAKIHRECIWAAVGKYDSNPKCSEVNRANIEIPYTSGDYLEGDKCYFAGGGYELRYENSTGCTPAQALTEAQKRVDKSQYGPCVVKPWKK